MAVAQLHIKAESLAINSVGHRPTEITPPPFIRLKA